MYSRKGEGRSDSYVIYRSNLPPRYSGSRFTSDESFAETANIECREETDARQAAAPICDLPRSEAEIHKRRRRQLKGKCRAISQSKAQKRCDKHEHTPIGFPFSRLGHEELLLGMIILLLAKEKHTAENGEMMLILALLLALK